jgi:predicted phage gp36 major capsid-like protein
MAEQEQQKAVVAQAGLLKPAQPLEIPVHEIDDVVNTVGGLMHLPPEATSGNIQGQVQAANALIKLADELQG